MADQVVALVIASFHGDMVAFVNGFQNIGYVFFTDAGVILCLAL